jgi:LPXTG-site transpeptidase (sortase) family protein
MTRPALNVIRNITNMILIILTYISILLILFAIYAMGVTSKLNSIEQSELREAKVEQKANSASRSVDSRPPGRLKIPAIHIDAHIVRGAYSHQLRRGPGMLPGSVEPGMLGNVVIAGHRATWGAPFANLDELRAGDPIILETALGRWVYHVIAPPGAKLAASQQVYEIVQPSDVQVAEQLSGVARLTLITCHPRWSSAQRLVVVAELQGPAIDTEKSPPIAEPLRLDRLGFGAPAAADPASFIGPGAVAWCLWALATWHNRRRTKRQAAFRYALGMAMAAAPLLILFSRITDSL